MTFALTKIQAPRPRAALVDRPALQARLADALATRRVVLICAPAGFGKTTALVHEIARLPPDHAAAWISADEGDDLPRLLDCMVAALEPYDPPWRTAPEALAAQAGRAAPDEARALAAEIINTLDACEVARGIIVFDDLHRVDDAAFFRFLDLLIERLSPRWCVAITSRTEPPLALARLRARDELAEFRQLQLQFARDEARQVALAAGLDVALADRLFDRTHGWPAGLRIAVGSAQASSGSAPASAPRSVPNPEPIHGDRKHDLALRAADRPMFDYLAAEVLDRLPPDLADFLLRVSVLPELEPTRCPEVSGSADAPRLLDAVERLDLFVTVVDESPRTLRLHDLFRDALQHRLRIERPDAWRECLQRAAANERDPVRRQGFLLAAGREEEAARALLDAAPSFNLGGAASTVLKLAAAFAPQFVAASAELQRALGLTKQTLWHLHDAERHYAQAYDLYRARGDAAAAQIVLARRAGILAPLGRLAETAELLATVQAAPLADPEAQMIAATADLWLGLERNEFDRMAMRFEKLLRPQLPAERVEDWQTIPPPRLTVCRGVAPLILQWASGALRVAGDRPVPLRAFALLAQGWTALWQARLDDAADLLARAETEAQWVGEHVIARSHALALRALLALARGDRALAMQTMRQRIDAQPIGYGDWGMWHALYVAVRVAAACGDVDATRAWLARLLAMQPALTEASARRLHPARGLQGTLAWLENRRDDALAHWRAALEDEEASDLMGQANELRVRLAAARLQAGAITEAAAWLEPVLQPPDEGPRGAVFVAPLLVELARADWHGQLADASRARLIAWAQALRPPEVARPVAAQPMPAPSAGVDPLTARELDVLALIARGDSNKLIARAFDLSLHTVKRHVANILGKLGLESRGQAAAWYRGNVR